jgi:general secretion pathway protein K
MRRRDERGVVLLVVLVFALLLTGTVATFLSRATLDSMIVRNRDARGNRDARARADALARGGLRLAQGLILADLTARTEENLALNTSRSLWAQVSGREIATQDGGTLQIRIEDSGARLNLNAVIQRDEGNQLPTQAQPLLEELLEKVITEMQLPPADKVYDVPELAANLIDYVDPDEVGLRGGSEDDYYQLQNPPYRAANRPLLSVNELRRVEGFDAKLVEALEPYVTVYPYAGTGGINLNTAPPHVLALLFFDDGVDLRLAPESTVREILEAREEGGLICAEDQSDESCTPIRELVTNAIYPPPDMGSDVFTVVTRARVGDVTRSIEAVIHRLEEGEVHLLSWRVL